MHLINNHIFAFGSKSCLLCYINRQISFFISSFSTYNLNTKKSAPAGDIYFFLANILVNRGHFYYQRYGLRQNSLPFFHHHIASMEKSAPLPCQLTLLKNGTFTKDNLRGGNNEPKKKYFRRSSPPPSPTLTLHLGPPPNPAPLPLSSTPLQMTYLLKNKYITTNVPCKILLYVGKLFNLSADIFLKSLGVHL